MNVEGLRAAMHPLATGESGSPAGSAAHRKLVKAAQEFEGMLISQLWGDLASGFSSLGGDAPMAGSETLNSLAIQTLSSALAKSGGLGIGKMLVQQLEPSPNRQP